jgi:hypothetical protein
MELMKRNIIASLVSVTVLAFGGMALAQTKPAAPPKGGAAAPAGSPAKGKVKNYDFDADQLEGDIVKPEGEFSTARKFADHGSLIHVRTDFIKEIVKSAEDL